MNPGAGLAVFYASWPATSALWQPKTGAGNTGRAIHNLPGTKIMDGEVVMTGHTLQYPASTFPAVRQGDRFIVDAEAFIVTEPPLATQDGLEYIAQLAKTS